MKLNIILLLLAGTTLTSACSPSVPKCSDDLVVTTVEGIYKKQMEALLSSLDFSMSFKVDTIRTLDTNSTTGAHECAAMLNIVTPNEPAASQSRPIKYKVETLDDTAEVYVSIIK